MLFDTHAHLDDERFKEDFNEVLDKIKNAGVDFVVNPGYDIPSSKNAVLLSEKYDFIYAAVGVHPHDSDSLTEDGIDTLKELSKNKKVVAIGEIGLDYYYDLSDREIQKKWFSRQMELALEVKKPVIIHDRDAHKDTMDILKANGVEKTGGVLHCFSGSVEMAREALDLGMYISFAGPVTFKNAKKLVEVAEYVPLDKIFIETDSPYLTPVPKRGERNDCSNVRYVAEKISEIKNIPFEEVCRQTKENALSFFGIKK